MSESVDVVVLGMGPGGEVAASALLAAGRTVAVVERELIGGECGYWACIPSKTLLRAPEAKTGVDRVDGVSGAGLDWAGTRAWRDDMIRHLDDSKQVTGYQESGATVLKGVGQITGPGTVEVDGRVLATEHIIVATGSEAFLPPVPGLAAAREQGRVWTNREATTLTDIPDRVVMLGGSAVGVELGVFLHRYGAAVTILERSGRLLSREDPRPGELTGTYLTGEGVDVRTGVTATAIGVDGQDTVVALDDGTEVRCDVVVVGSGRTPRTAGLGLETVGVTLGDRGEVVVDDHCRAAANVWGVGDVTAVMAFTHVAMYQGQVVADNILGTDRTARYDGIPRVVFADPEVAAVGLTTAQAAQRGLRTVSTEVDLSEAIARPWTYETEPRGHLGVLADADTQTLIGAWAVGPMASEWIHTPALAIREQIPLERLTDQIAQFPTYTEGWLAAYRQLHL